MGKLTIIEKSRFLTEKESGNIQGGAIDHTIICTLPAAHTDCVKSSYFSCGPASFAGFTSGSCPEGGSAYITCGGVGIAYDFCIDWGRGKNTLCGGVNNPYKGK